MARVRRTRRRYPRSPQSHHPQLEGGATQAALAGPGSGKAGDFLRRAGTPATDVRAPWRPRDSGGGDTVGMCRWMGWSGQPMIVDELLFKPKHGLVEQSLHSRMGVETTNGDGFGLGWYGQGEGPGVYHSVAPAWGDPNLRELASHIESHMFLAHVRATTAPPSSRPTATRSARPLAVRPQRRDRRLREMRRELCSPSPRSCSPRSRARPTPRCFYLALTFGLEDDPVSAIEQAVGLVEAAAAKHGIEHPVQASMGVTDGERLWAFRYSSEGRSRSLFASADAQAVRRLHPENARLQQLRDEDRVVVSEPFADLPAPGRDPRIDAS